MKFADLEKYKFKLRSLPNSKTIHRYGDAFIYFGAILAGYNFIAICLFYDDFMPRMPSPFVLAIPLLFIHIYASIESDFIHVNREAMKEVIIHIRLNQFQSLKEKIEENPEMLHEKYEKKSLLFWARYHKNLQAHSYLIGEMRKLKKEAYEKRSA